MSEIELLRLTFADRGALEREIANNLRYGRIFTGELLKYPVLTEGLLVLVHPVHGGELKLQAQVVMVNPDGPMKGTGLALRAFGPADVEVVEAFARTAVANAAAHNRSASSTANAAANAAAQNRSAGSAANAAAKAPTHQVGSQTAAAQNRSASSTANAAAKPQTPQVRTPSSTTHTATAARPPSGTTNTATRAQAHQPNQAPPPRRPASSDSNPRSASAEVDRDQTASMRQPPARPASDRTGTPAAGMRSRTASNLANRAVRAATEVNAHSGVDRERTGSMPQPTARARSTTNFRPATEVSATPQPAAARPRAGSGVANAVVRPATEVDASVRVDRDRDGPSPQPSAARARPPSSSATAVTRSVAQPARAASASSATNAALRAGADDRDDWSDFEHGPEPGTAKVTPAAANANAVATVAPPAAAAPSASTGEDDWSDFEHGPESSAAAPPPSAAKAMPAEAPTAAGPNPLAQPSAATDPEDDWSDFEHGPEPSAAAPQPTAASPAQAETPVAAATPSPAQSAPAAAEDDWSDFEHGPEPGAALPSPPPTAAATSAFQAPAVAATAPLEPPAPAQAEEDDWSDFEHAPEPGAALPSPPAARAADLHPPAAEGSDPDDEDRLVLPSGLPLAGAASGAHDPNNAVTIRPAPSDEVISDLVERSREADDDDPAATAAESTDDEEAAFDEDADFNPDARSPDLQSTNRQERLRALNVVEQLKVARRGELADRVVIERLYGKTVWEALLQNPRITVPEVARIARKGTVPRPLLDTILENGTWLRDAAVRRALLSNPKVTGESILKLLRLTPRHELKVMEKGTAYSLAVRDAIKKLLRE